MKSIQLWKDSWNDQVPENSFPQLFSFAKNQWIFIRDFANQPIKPTFSPSPIHPGFPTISRAARYDTQICKLAEFRHLDLYMGQLNFLHQEGIQEYDWPQTNSPYLSVALEEQMSDETQGILLASP